MEHSLGLITSWATNPTLATLRKLKSSKQKKKGIKEKHRIKWKTSFKMAINTYLSIITLNVNGLNAPTKRHRLAEWIQKQDPYICCLQEIHFTSRDTYKLKERMEENISCKRGPKESWSSNTHIRQNRL